MTIKRFQFGEWQVNAQSCTIRHGEEAAESQIEPRAMDVLSALCLNAGQIMSADDLLHRCWDGIAVGENQVHKAITQLRRALRDSATQPRYIENIRKRGYRTVALVSFPPQHTSGQSLETWSRESPYVGLDPFDAGHAAVFFGRDVAITGLRETVIAQVAAGRALVLVLGPSGSGKTSLVQAGLLPALRRDAGRFRISGAVTLDLGDISTVPLPTALGGALLDLDRDGEPLFAGQSAESIGADLTGDTSTLWQDDRAEPDEKFVLFVDRLEALFSTAGTLHRGRFLTALDRLAQSGLFIVIAACRNDFYPDLAREPVLMAGKAAGGHFDLAPPSRTDIAQMIRLSAKAAGLSFGTDPDSNDHLDDLLCDGAATSPDALPLLQYTLQQLYLQRSPARELTMAAYRALGGIDGVIGRRAETVLSGLALPSQAALPRIFSLIVAEGAADGSVRSLRAPWSALTTQDERLLVQTLVAERLFVSHVYDREAVFGVAHEALLRQWPRAVAWIAEHRQALRTRSRLDGLAQQWIAEGRQTDRLLRRGKPLEEARDLAERAAVPLGPEVTALIAASIRQATRADRLRLGALTGFAVIALVAVLLGFRASEAEAVAARRLQQAEDLTDYMLGDFAEKLRPLGRLDLLDGVTQKALGYLTAADAGRVPGASRLRQAKALQTLADVDRSRGNVEAALKALTQAEALLQANLAEGPPDQELLKISGAVSFWFGQIARDQGRIDDAERRFTDYRGFAQRMTALDPDDPDAWIELSYALSNLGSLELRQGEEDAAAANFEQSIALKRRALERRPKDRTLTAELANSLSFLARAEAERGRLEPAAELYDQQRDTLEGLHRTEPDASVWSYRLALANKLKGALLAALGRAPDALSDLDRAAGQIEDSLTREPDNRLWQAERIAIRLARARIYLALRRPADAVSDVAAAQTEIDQTIGTNPADENLQWQQDEAHLLHTTALLQQGKLGEAEKDTGQSEDLARSFTDRDKKAKFKIILLSNILLARAEIDRQRGAPDTARRKCMEAADVLRAIAQSSNDFRILDPWVRANSCGGDRQSAVGSIAALERMGYRDIDYLRFLATVME